ncbi:hypothetical protein [Arsenicicoccus dermatophilus]|uniref:hypothetical protein n=1 Tax=Arsenicicoccus dermatophilus TaxID=1076331 RepID=UPI001F4CE8EC|nr:hypothetical protein [Arsenicicoccus dermatophilus]MCH8613496.1 hypothetical protein [Arsenicicoccus dermatophilus]
MDVVMLAGCARELDERAEWLAVAAARVAAEAAAVDWESAAADLAQQQVGGLLLLLRASSRQTQLAAAAVRAHVEAVTAGLAAVERAARVCVEGVAR